MPSSTFKILFAHISFLLFLVLALPIKSSAQQLEWRYEYDTGERTHPAYFWVDEDGNGYYNIKKTRPNNTRTFDRQHSLLILNKEGAYNGSVYIKKCGRGGLILPSVDDKYILSGVDCTNGQSGVKKSYLLDYAGQILKEGKTFEGNYFAQSPTDKGLVYFSKPTVNFSHTYLSIGLVDAQFNISNDSIPLKPLEKEGYGMVFNYIDPVQLENKSWILPFNYGVVSTGISVDHGSVFCVKDGRIAWQYPDTLNQYVLEDIAYHKNTVTLLMRSSRQLGSQWFVQLDADGNVVQSTSFRPVNRSIKSMEVDDEHIILLSSSGIDWYDWDGNLVGKYDLGQAQINGKEMRLLPDGTIIVSGKYGNNCVFVKLSMTDEDVYDEETSDEITSDEVASDDEMGDDDINDDEDLVEEEQEEIHYAEAIFESDDVFSASVFPNPASLRINFEISRDIDQHSAYFLEVFDASGREVFKDSFKSHFYELGVSAFIAGTYIYRITEVDGQGKEFISGKFIKV